MFEVALEQYLSQGDPLERALVYEKEQANSVEVVECVNALPATSAYIRRGVAFEMLDMPLNWEKLKPSIEKSPYLREHSIEEEEANIRLPLEGHLARKLIDVTKVKELSIVSKPTVTEEMTALEEWYLLTKSVMLMCKVGSTFAEPLDHDEPIALTDAVDDDDEEEEEDATTRKMIVDDIEDADN
ncbi:hypothetical protein HAX54_003303 [Datura stramonium]|uniref:Uncharacterized protein n=1 Tax=Datura stramonium TaxID=4076 RepID=A0ABS8T549_DATST|nr:hypothetical protein [Datura stramonium]